jgi:hypothetical protein
MLCPNLTEANKAYYSDALLAQAQRREQRVQIDYSTQAARGAATPSGSHHRAPHYPRPHHRSGRAVSENNAQRPAGDHN